ncbi:MAG: FmdE family protein [Treponema sp.]|jgi:formylmethanofuran dehydrogenase subunit E|nr:FmdE family protein [Treponema sp.]
MPPVTGCRGRLGRTKEFGEQYAGKHRKKALFWGGGKKIHGHESLGLAKGVRVCEVTIEKMGLEPSGDEELVCNTETDACGVDAVQAILSCTIGKGNLIYKGTGKNAFTFIRRKDGKAMRFYAKTRNKGMERDALQQYVLDAPVDELFTFRETSDESPEIARIFKSVDCEAAAGRKKVCLDYFKE